MKTILVIVVLLISLSTTAHAMKFPEDGNGLLEFCGQIVESADSPQDFSKLPPASFEEAFAKLSWCAGYLEAVRSISLNNFVLIGMLNKMDAPIGSTDPKKQQFFTRELEIACLPDRLPTIQLARVLVKWLRDHPERLHEPIFILTKSALQDAFPCSVGPTPPLSK